MSRYKVFLIVWIFACLTSFSAHAGPIVHISVLPEESDGLYHYSYSIEDSPNADQGVYAFTINSVFNIFEDLSGGPAGWERLFDFTDNAFIWVSEDSSFDLQPGSTLGGFELVSDLAPGPAQWIALGSDPVSGFPTGDFDSALTIGPNSPVPEPATSFIMSMVLLLLCGLTFIKNGLLPKW